MQDQHVFWRGVNTHAGVILDCCGEQGAELEGEAFDIYQMIYVRTVTHGHEFQRVTERMRLGMQVVAGWLSQSPLGHGEELRHLE